MLRSQSILAVLLAGALLWAYLLSHPDKEAATHSGRTVTVWDAPVREIGQLYYRNGKSHLTLSPVWKEGEERPSIWISSWREPKKGAVEEPAQQPPIKKTNFKGNEASFKLLQSLANLRAVRRVGSMEQLNGKEFGLPEPKKIIELTMEGGQSPLKLEIGSYNFSKSMRYILETRDNRIYLLRSSLLRPLNRVKTALLDKKLFPFPVEEAEKIIVKKSGVEKTLWRLKQMEKASAAWGEKPDAEMDISVMWTFVNSLKNLKVVSYLEENELPEGEEPLLSVLIQAEGGEKPESWLHLYPRTPARAPARSSYTERPVLIPPGLAKRVLDNAGRVLAGI